jgi:hypothetical protein
MFFFEKKLSKYDCHTFKTFSGSFSSFFNLKLLKLKELFLFFQCCVLLFIVFFSKLFLRFLVFFIGFLNSFHVVSLVYII